MKNTFLMAFKIFIFNKSDILILLTNKLIQPINISLNVRFIKLSFHLKWNYSQLTTHLKGSYYRLHKNIMHVIYVICRSEYEIAKNDGKKSDKNQSKVSIESKFLILFGTHDACLLIFANSSLKEVSLSLKRDHFHPIERIFTLIDFRNTKSTHQSVSNAFNVLCHRLC